MKEEDKCPHIITKRAGDDDMCRFLEERCLIEHGGECETWNEIQQEEK